MSCLPTLSYFSFWPQRLVFWNSKPSLGNNLEEGIVDIDGLEKVEIETIAATYEGDHSATFWLHPRKIQDVPRIDGFYRATVRYDSEVYKVERFGQIPWSAKGSVPICFFWNKVTRVQVSIPYAEARTLIPDLPELPPNIFAAIFNSLIRR
ncbi:hypothetical protein TMatcc_001232 [Talaromyces marneffei ATCC 18224]